MHVQVSEMLESVAAEQLVVNEALVKGSTFERLAAEFRLLPFEDAKTFWYKWNPNKTEIPLNIFIERIIEAYPAHAPVLKSITNEQWCSYFDKKTVDENIFVNSFQNKLTSSLLKFAATIDKSQLYNYNNIEVTIDKILIQNEKKGKVGEKKLASIATCHSDNIEDGTRVSIFDKMAFKLNNRNIINAFIHSFLILNSNIIYFLFYMKYTYSQY